MSYSRGSCTWFKFISRLVCYFKVVSLQKLSLYNSFWCISPIQNFINSPTKPTFCGFQNINTNYTIENYDSMHEEGPSGKKCSPQRKRYLKQWKKFLWEVKLNIFEACWRSHTGKNNSDYDHRCLQVPTSYKVWVLHRKFNRHESLECNQHKMKTGGCFQYSQRRRKEIFKRTGTVTKTK